MSESKRISIDLSGKIVEHVCQLCGRTVSSGAMVCGQCASALSVPREPPVGFAWVDRAGQQMMEDVWNSAAVGLLVTTRELFDAGTFDASRLGEVAARALFFASLPMPVSCSGRSTLFDRAPDLFAAAVEFLVGSDQQAIYTFFDRAEEWAKADRAMRRRSHDWAINRN